MSRTVALVGMIVPFVEDHPDDDLEVWCVNRAFQNQKNPLPSKVFFFDNPNRFEDGFVEQLNELPESVELLARKKWPDIPRCGLYPIQDVIDSHGGIRYFTCTVAYMLAYAIHLKFERIVLAGMYWVHDSAEYFMHKPCVEYWIGVADGRGIKVDVQQPTQVEDKNGERIDVDGRTMLLKAWPWSPALYGYVRQRNEGLAIQTMSCAYQASLGYPVCFMNSEDIDEDKDEIDRDIKMRRAISASVKVPPARVEVGYEPKQKPEPATANTGRPDRAVRNKTWHSSQRAKQDQRRSPATPN